MWHQNSMCWTWNFMSLVKKQSLIFPTYFLCPAVTNLPVAICYILYLVITWWLLNDWSSSFISGYKILWHAMNPMAVKFCNMSWICWLWNFMTCHEMLNVMQHILPSVINFAFHIELRRVPIAILCVSCPDHGAHIFALRM